MASRDADVSGEARIGVIGTTARWLMPELLAAVGRDHPLVHTIVHEGSTTTLIPAVISGQLHAAIVHLPIDDPELVIAPLFAEDLLVIVPDDHQFADRSSMALTDLDDIPLLLPPQAPRSGGCSTGPPPRRSRCAPKPRSMVCACSHRWRSTATGQRSFPPRRSPSGSRAVQADRGSRAPAAGRRLGAASPAGAQRGGPSGRHTAQRGRRTRRRDQPGVHGGADAFPLGRSV